jgi:hypothetical protein
MDKKPLKLPCKGVAVLVHTNYLSPLNESIRLLIVESTG